MKHRLTIKLLTTIVTSVVLIVAVLMFIKVNYDKSKTPYELAVENGYVGTENEWLAALVAEFGENGKTAYDIAVEKGYKANYDTWIKDLNK